MTGYIRHLGTLTPDVQQRLENSYQGVEDLAAQAQTAMLLMQEVDAPADVISKFAAELGNLRDVGLQLHGELASMVEDGESAAWSARVTQLRKQLQDLMVRIEKSRKGAHSALEFSGLYWGLGAAGAALAFGYVVWRARNKKRTSRK